MPSVRRKEVPRPPVCPSSPQEDSHRQQTHHLLEPRSRAAQVLRQQLQGLSGALGAGFAPPTVPVLDLDILPWVLASHSMLHKAIDRV